MLHRHPSNHPVAAQWRRCSSPLALNIGHHHSGISSIWPYPCLNKCVDANAVVIGARYDHLTSPVSNGRWCHRLWEANLDEQHPIPHPTEVIPTITSSSGLTQQKWKYCPFDRSKTTWQSTTSITNTIQRVEMGVSEKELYCAPKMGRLKSGIPCCWIGILTTNGGNNYKGLHVQLNSRSYWYARYMTIHKMWFNCSTLTQNYYLTAKYYTLTNSEHSNKPLLICKWLFSIIQMSCCIDCAPWLNSNHLLWRIVVYCSHPNQTSWREVRTQSLLTK